MLIVCVCVCVINWSACERHVHSLFQLMSLGHPPNAASLTRTHTLWPLYTNAGVWPFVEESILGRGANILD